MFIFVIVMVLSCAKRPRKKAKFRQYCFLLNIGLVSLLLDIVLIVQSDVKANNDFH